MTRRKDNDYYQSQVEAIFKKELDTLYQSMVAHGCTVEEIRTALNAKTQEQYLEMLCAGQEPPNN